MFDAVDTARHRDSSSQSLERIPKPLSPYAAPVRGGGGGNGRPALSRRSSDGGSSSTKSAGGTKRPVVLLSTILKQCPQLFDRQKLSAAGQFVTRLDELPGRYQEAETVYLSQNSLTSLAGIQQFKRLRVLSLADNLIHDHGELIRLAAACPGIEIATFERTPLAQLPHYREHAVVLLPALKQLDGRPVKPEERPAAAAVVQEDRAMLAVLFSNACTVQKLTAASRLVSLHTELLTALRGPTAVVRRYLDPPDAATDPERLLALWDYEGGLTPGEGAALEGALRREVAREMQALLREHRAASVTPRGSGGGGAATAAAPPAAPRPTWSDAFRNVMAAQQVTISRLVQGMQGAKAELQAARASLVADQSRLADEQRRSAGVQERQDVISDLTAAAAGGGSRQTSVGGSSSIATTTSSVSSWQQRQQRGTVVIAVRSPVKSPRKLYHITKNANAAAAAAARQRRSSASSGEEQEEEEVEDLGRLVESMAAGAEAVERASVGTWSSRSSRSSDGGERATHAPAMRTRGRSCSTNTNTTTTTAAAAGGAAARRRSKSAERPATAAAARPVASVATAGRSTTPSRIPRPGQQQQHQHQETVPSSPTVSTPDSSISSIHTVDFGLTPQKAPGNTSAAPQPPSGAYRTGPAAAVTTTSAGKLGARPRLPSPLSRMSRHSREQHAAAVKGPAPLLPTVEWRSRTPADADVAATSNESFAAAEGDLQAEQQQALLMQQLRARALAVGISPSSSPSATAATAAATAAAGRGPSVSPSRMPSALGTYAAAGRGPSAAVPFSPPDSPTVTDVSFARGMASAAAGSSRKAAVSPGRRTGERIVNVLGPVLNERTTRFGSRGSDDGASRLPRVQPPPSPPAAAGAAAAAPVAANEAAQLSSPAPAPQQPSRLPAPYVAAAAAPQQQQLQAAPAPPAAAAVHKPVEQSLLMLSAAAQQLLACLQQPGGGDSGPAAHSPAPAGSSQPPPQLQRPVDAAPVDSQHSAVAPSASTAAGPSSGAAATASHHLAACAPPAAALPANHQRYQLENPLYDVSESRGGAACSDAYVAAAAAGGDGAGRAAEAGSTPGLLSTAQSSRRCSSACGGGCGTSSLASEDLLLFVNEPSPVRPLLHDDDGSQLLLTHSPPTPRSAAGDSPRALSPLRTSAGAGGGNASPARALPFFNMFLYEEDGAHGGAAAAATDAAAAAAAAPAAPAAGPHHTTVRCPPSPGRAASTSMVSCSAESAVPRATVSSSAAEASAGSAISAAAGIQVVNVTHHPDIHHHQKRDYAIPPNRSTLVVIEELPPVEAAEAEVAAAAGVTRQLLRQDAATTTSVDRHAGSDSVDADVIAAGAPMKQQQQAPIGRAPAVAAVAPLLPHAVQQRLLSTAETQTSPRESQQTACGGGGDVADWQLVLSPSSRSVAPRLQLSDDVPSPSKTQSEVSNLSRLQPQHADALPAQSSPSQRQKALPRPPTRLPPQKLLPLPAPAPPAAAEAAASGQQQQQSQTPHEMQVALQQALEQLQASVRKFRADEEASAAAAATASKAPRPAMVDSATSPGDSAAAAAGGAAAGDQPSPSSPLRLAVFGEVVHEERLQRRQELWVPPAAVLARALPIDHPMAARVRILRQRVNGRQLHLLLRAWRAAADAARLKAERLAAADTHLRCRTLVKALAAWRSAVAQARREAAGSATADVLRSTHLRRRSLDAWRYFMAGRRAEWARRCEAASHWHEAVVLRQALAAWAYRVRQHRRAVEHEEKAAVFRLVSLANRGLGGWRAVVADRKRERIGRTMAKEHHRVKLMVRALRAWAALSPSWQRHHALEAGALHKSMQAVVRWKQIADKARRWSVGYKRAVQFYVRRQAALCRRILQRWHLAAVTSQRDASRLEAQQVAGQLAAVQAEAAAAREAAAAQAAQLAAANDGIASLAKQLAAAHEAAACKAGQLADAHKALARAGEERDRLVAQLATAADDLSSLMAQLRGREEAVQQLTADVASKADEVARLQADVRVREEGASRLEGELSGLKAELREVQMQLAHTVAGSDQQLSLLHDNMQAVAEEVAARSAQFEALQAALRDRDAAVAELEATLAARDEELDAAVAQAEALQQQGAALAEALAAREGEAEALRQVVQLQLQAAPAAPAAASPAAARGSGSRRESDIARIVRAQKKHVAKGDLAPGAAAVAAAVEPGRVVSVPLPAPPRGAAAGVQAPTAQPSGWVLVQPPPPLSLSRRASSAGVAAAAVGPEGDDYYNQKQRFEAAGACRTPPRSARPSNGAGSVAGAVAPAAPAAAAVCIGSPAGPGSPWRTNMAAAARVVVAADKRMARPLSASGAGDVARMLDVSSSAAAALPSLHSSAGHRRSTGGSARTTRTTLSDMTELMAPGGSSSRRTTVMSAASGSDAGSASDAAAASLMGNDLLISHTLGAGGAASKVAAVPHGRSWGGSSAAGSSLAADATDPVDSIAGFVQQQLRLQGQL